VFQENLSAILKVNICYRVYCTSSIQTHSTALVRLISVPTIIKYNDLFIIHNSKKLIKKYCCYATDKFWLVAAVASTEMH
jgi:hypothetical protein